MNWRAYCPYLNELRQPHYLLAGALLVLALVACGDGEERGVPTIPSHSTGVQTTVTVVVPTAAVETPAPAASETASAPEPTVSATATTVPTLPDDTSLQTAALLAGVIYRTEDALYQLDEDGEPVPLSPNSSLILSPSGARGLYLSDGDVWVVDTDTGEERNVTAGSGRTHVSARWWPARPETLVLMSWGEGEQGPNSGKLTLVQVDGSNYRVAHPQGALSFAEPDPGPDGQTIAYDETGSPWLYRMDEAVAQPFAPSTYLPRDVEVARGASPAWSPDGRRLAWMMGLRGTGYGTGEAWDAALVVFNLDNLTASIIHPFAPVGRGGWFPAARWSPDSEWLLFSVETPDVEENGLWVTTPDGSAKVRLHPVANAPAFWSPAGEEGWQDGAYVLLAEPGDRLTDRAWLIARGSWQMTPVTRPEGATFVDWRNLVTE